MSHMEKLSVLSLQCLLEDYEPHEFKDIIHVIPPDLSRMILRYYCFKLMIIGDKFLYNFHNTIYKYHVSIPKGAWVSLLGIMKRNYTLYIFLFDKKHMKGAQTSSEPGIVGAQTLSKPGMSIILDAFHR